MHRESSGVSLPAVFDISWIEDDSRLYSPIEYGYFEVVVGTDNGFVAYGHLKSFDEDQAMN